MASKNATSVSHAAHNLARRRFCFNAGLQYGTLIALVVLVVFNLAFTPGFRSTQALFVTLTQVAPIVVVATGMTFVIATGGIDLSVGSLMAIAGTLAALVLKTQIWPLSGSVVGTSMSFMLPVAVSGLLGFFNGWLITSRHLQPIIDTLVLFIAGRGFAQALTNGGHIEINRPDFQYIAFGRPGGLPVQVILMLIVVMRSSLESSPRRDGTSWPSAAITQRLG